MPPSLSEYERLFLLEFFVDFVTIKNTAFSVTESTLCVSFQFLHFPVMRVCEEEFIPQSKAALAEDSKVVFKGGKSCLFSVHPDENNKISSTFNLIIAVCQRKKDCPNRQLIGQAAVNLGTSFLNLLEARTDAAFSSESSVKYDLYPLKDKFKRVVGAVAAFARLSNFGKMIITQFQLAAEDNMNYMFKGTDNKKLFKDDPMMDFSVIQREQPRPSEGRPKLSEQKSYGQRPISQASVRKSSIKQSSDSCLSSSSSSCTALSLDDSSKNNKLLDKSRKSSNMGGACCCCPPEPPVCQFAPKLNICDCDFPLPPGMIPRCPPQCCQPPPCCQSSRVPPSTAEVMSGGPLDSIGQDQSNPTESIPVCTREDCPLGLFVPGPPADPMELEPGCVAMKGDQVFFQMANRPAGEPVNEKEKKLASSVYYTVGATEAGKETMSNFIQITPQSPQGTLMESPVVSGPVSGLPLDNKHDMFLFKVLKQNDTISAKCKLEMELRTPKEKEIKPPSNTVDTQYLVTDFPPVEKKGKKGGKADKKGKKK